jgi:hypothetical protein
MKKNISDTIKEVLIKEQNISEESRVRLEQIKNDCDKTIKSLSQVNTQNVTKIHHLELTNGKLKTRNKWMWVVIIFLSIFSFRRQFAKLII